MRLRHKVVRSKFSTFPANVSVKLQSSSHSVVHCRLRRAELLARSCNSREFVAQDVASQGSAQLPVNVKPSHEDISSTARDGEGTTETEAIESDAMRGSTREAASFDNESSVRDSPRKRPVRARTHTGPTSSPATNSTTTTTTTTTVTATAAAAASAGAIVSQSQRVKRVGAARSALEAQRPPGWSRASVTKFLRSKHLRRLHTQHESAPPQPQPQPAPVVHEHTQRQQDEAQAQAEADADGEAEAGSVSAAAGAQASRDDDCMASASPVTAGSLQSRSGTEASDASIRDLHFAAAASVHAGEHDASPGELSGPAGRWSVGGPGIPRAASDLPHCHDDARTSSQNPSSLPPPSYPSPSEAAEAGCGREGAVGGGGGAGTGVAVGATATSGKESGEESGSPQVAEQHTQSQGCVEVAIAGHVTGSNGKLPEQGDEQAVGQELGQGHGQDQKQDQRQLTFATAENAAAGAVTVDGQQAEEVGGAALVLRKDSRASQQEARGGAENSEMELPLSSLSSGSGRSRDSEGDENVGEEEAEEEEEEEEDENEDEEEEEEEDEEEEEEEMDLGLSMCASTTGVVRVQTRQKAEMFLVRTDGISCTRERVTESTLAFTHPSTQQQMLMWGTRPRTALLLKKLGHELLEQAMEVREHGLRQWGTATDSYCHCQAGWYWCCQAG